MKVRKMVPPRLQPAARVPLLAWGAATSQWRVDPSFMVIGGQRCGTTSIFKALADHPQALRPPTDKGTDYYTLHYNRGMSWYRSHMPTAVTARSATRDFGAPQAFEACTYYLFHPCAAERIAKDFPEIKLVAMLRDPVTRAYSAYKHEFARGFEREDSFMRALELEDERLAGEVDRMYADATYESHAHRHQAYRHRGQFAEQLERYYQVLDRSNIHVMSSEAFFADPGAEYRRLTRFLGLADWAPSRFDQHNARPGSPMPEDARHFLTEHYRDHDARLSELLGHRLPWAD